MLDGAVAVAAEAAPASSSGFTWFYSRFHGIIDPPNPQSLTSVLLLHEPTNLSEEGLPTPKIAHITGLSQIVEARGFIIGNSPVIRPFFFNPQTNSAY